MRSGGHHDIDDPLDGIGCLTFALWWLVVIPFHLALEAWRERRRA